MDVTIVDIQQSKYAIVILSETGRISCEYYLEYPDLRCSQLAYASDADLAKEHIAGYAVCEWDDLLWVVRSFRCSDINRANQLNTYVATKLNRR